jgi:hypothetical protein
MFLSQVLINGIIGMWESLKSQLTISGLIRRWELPTLILAFQRIPVMH